MKRVFLIVLDSCGAGAMPDAALFGDSDCHTLRRISTSPRFSCECVRRLGMGNIEGLDFLGRVSRPRAAVCRLSERSRGKDTTIGHWEIAGAVSPEPLPTYPEGFPREIIEAFSAETGRGVLCNKPYSGTDVIRDYGEEQLKTGAWIVYTSADSVFQIAAHDRVIPLSELYDACRTARRILCGKHAVGRVIARPFTGDAPFLRTADRRDFSLEPPRETLLDTLKAAGRDVIAVGKISDIFAGRGVTRTCLTHSNEEGMRVTAKLSGEPFEGLCFVNLVEFDSLYGHRQDVDGYADAFATFDRWLPEFLPGMREEDLLMITADHGCDPGDSHTDHTREYIPLLAVGRRIKPVNLGTRHGFGDIGATVADALGVTFHGEGNSFWGQIRRD